MPTGRSGSKSMQSARVSAAIAAVILSFSAFAGVANADEYHYTNMLVGERPAGLAGAYTAVSDDPAGMYYNPAGISFRTGGNLSASLNAYFVSNKNYDNALGSQAWERSMSALQPNFFGIVQDFWKGALGFSYAVPDSISSDQDQVFTDFQIQTIENNLPKTVNVKRYAINYDQDDNTYLFGPSYAMKITEDLAIGTTLYIHYRDHEQIANLQSIYIVNQSDVVGWGNVYIEGRELGLRPMIGLMWSPSDEKYAIGASVSKTFILDSNFSVVQSSYLEGKFERYEAATDARRQTELKVAVGGAWFPTQSIMLSADVTYYSGVDEVSDKTPEANYYPQKVQPLEPVVGIKKYPVINVAGGIEWYISPISAIRAGLFTNFANTPKVKSGGTDQEEHVDLYGGSLSYSMFSKSSSLTFGASVSRGTGQAQINSDIPTSIQNLDITNMLFFMGTSYSY